MLIIQHVQSEYKLSLWHLLNIRRFETPQRKIEYAMTQYIRRTNRRSGKNISHIIYHTHKGENLTICPRVGYFPNVVYRFSRYNLRVQDRRSRLRSAPVEQNASGNVEWSRSIAQASPRGASKEQEARAKLHSDRSKYISRARSSRKSRARSYEWWSCCIYINKYICYIPRGNHKTKTTSIRTHEISDCYTPSNIKKITIK